jgi:flagellin
MVVQHNISAMTANRYYGVNNKGLAGSLEKLASGYAINKAGDNAAGLAVSEKMRAQIGGLTQASKNAEDGISLVQTFEGALQETDSILQRMRTLAVQSANGSYQDDVDREAMQLEFDQLNDELNQIADTDYNGTIVLNGGQMADGLKAVNGKFDYANNERKATQLSSADVNGLETQGLDDIQSGNTNTNADLLWKDLGFDRTNTTTNDDGPDSVDITFKYDKSSGLWSAVSASNGASVADITTNATANNGGFQIGSTNSIAAPDVNSSLMNVSVDNSTLVNGDTLTITVNNPSVKNTAAENFVVTNADYDNLTIGTGTGAADSTSNLTITNTNATYESTNGAGTTLMTEDVNKFYSALEGATVTVDYGSTAAANPANVALNFTDADGNSYLLDKDNGSVVIGNTTFTATFAAASGLEIKAGGNTILKLAGDANTATNGSTGSVSYTIGSAESVYNKKTSASASVKEPDGVVSKSDAYKNSKATMTYSDSMTLQVGARTKDIVNFTFNYSSNGLGDLKANMNCSARTDGLGTADLSIKTQQDANAAIDKIDNAINKISMVRGTFGAIQNRLEHKISNLDTNTENMTAAESRIRDTQMDKEMMKFTSSQILSQASQSMLAQANQLPQGVLQLLG